MIMQNSCGGGGLCLPDGTPSELGENDFWGLFEELPGSNEDGSQPPSQMLKVETESMQNIYADGGLCLPYGVPCESRDNDVNDMGIFGESLSFNEDSSQLSMTPDVEVEPTEVSTIYVRGRPEKLQPIGTVNKYPIYPTLQAWGRFNRFHYDELGQLASDVVFDKETMHEYLYSHPLRKKLIVWVQRHPSQAQLIYQTNYGGSCRYKGCRPGKKPARTIQVGHYRLAFDELTPRHPRHKANSYLYAAFFHVSCFERMFDLADICRQFDVRCEDRPFTNCPIGDRTARTYIKNRMLLEERRIPHATAEWIKNAKGDPSWKTSCTEDSLNFLLFKKKWELRPHRKKCTNVPGMENVGDISHLATPRPVKPNPVWGGRRVKGLTVAQLQAMEARENGDVYGNSEDSLKRKRAKPGDDDDDDDEYLPSKKYFQTRSGRTPNRENPIVISSSRTPSPVRFRKPGKGRDDRRPPRAAGEEHPNQISIPPTKAVVKPKEQTTCYPAESNLENDIYPPLGSMIKTAYGWYVREPTTGAMVQVLNVVTPSATCPPTPSLPVPSQTLDSHHSQYQYNPPATDVCNSELWTPQDIHTQHDSMVAQQFVPEMPISIDPLLLGDTVLQPAASIPNTSTEALQEQDNIYRDQAVTEFDASPLTMEGYLFGEQLVPTELTICEDENFDTSQFSQFITDSAEPLGSGTDSDFLDDFFNNDMYLPTFSV